MHCRDGGCKAEAEAARGCRLDWFAAAGLTLDVATPTVQRCHTRSLVIVGSAHCQSNTMP
jgi:hypothetical protein